MQPVAARHPHSWLTVTCMAALCDPWCSWCPSLCRCSFGQELCLVGSGEALGNWSVENGKRMHWTDGDVWQVDFEVSAG